MESGKLEEVNRVLEGIKFAEAEEMVEVLGEMSFPLPAHLKKGPLQSLRWSEVLLTGYHISILCRPVV